MQILQKLIARSVGLVRAYHGRCGSMAYANLRGNFPLRTKMYANFRNRNRVRFQGKCKVKKYILIYTMLFSGFFLLKTRFGSCFGFSHWGRGFPGLADKGQGEVRKYQKKHPHKNLRILRKFWWEFSKSNKIFWL